MYEIYDNTYTLEEVFNNNFDFVDGESNQLKIEIGDICSLIRLDNLNIFDQLKTGYRKFLSIKNPNIKIDVCVKEDMKLNQHSESNKVPAVQIIRKNDELFFGWRDFVAYFDNRQGIARVVQPKEIASTENCLRILYSFLLMKQKGFLLHASGVINNECGYVFFGKSGSGKTTVARLSDYMVLSDDVVVIKKYNDTFKVCATPFGGKDIEIKRKINVCSRVCALFSLKKDQNTWFKKLTYSQAIFSLISNVICFSTELKQIEEILNLCSDLLTRSPCYEMHFLPDKSFWRKINDIPR
jgi:ABC-type molybdenum transport system ATPase subunit/photorepair protein PhrA